MAQIFRSLSSLLIVMACCFLKGTTAEDREGKQFLLPAAPNYPFYYYANSPPVFINAGESPTGVDARLSNDYGTDAVGRTFFRIFGCPTCPSCPGPVTCPTCPTCPAVPVGAVVLAPAVGECPSATLLAVATAISSCSRVSAAPRGTIDVTFLDPDVFQTVTIGIVAVAPNTQIKLTCTVIPTGGDSVAKTQVGSITANVPITSTGFLQIIASGSANPASAAKLTCSWVSA